VQDAAEIMGHSWAAAEPFRPVAISLQRHQPQLENRSVRGSTSAPPQLSATCSATVPTVLPCSVSPPSASVV